MPSGLVWACALAWFLVNDRVKLRLPLARPPPQAVGQTASSLAQRLIVALAAVHAARWAAIRDLTLDDVDLPNRRRCRTASWWRKIKISAVFQVSSR